MKNNLGYNLGKLFAIAEYICDLATKKTSTRYDISKHCEMFSTQPLKVLAVIDKAKIDCSTLLRRKGVCLDDVSRQYTECFEAITCETIKGVLSLENQGNFFLGYYSLKS